MFEKVNPMHPDKIADRIAGALVDMAYREEENPKIAVEVLIGHGECHIISESSVELDKREVIKAVCRISKQTPYVNLIQVPQDKHLSENQSREIRCGDNGIFKGVPVTEEEKELTRIAKSIYDLYQADGKYILGKDILGKDRLIICQSNAKTTDLKHTYPNAEINPLGDWTGGTDVDTGATNRKLGSDMAGSVTGGGLHGKDLSKADVSINIYAFITSQATNQPQEYSCAIGDKYIRGRITIPYEDIVSIARGYIEDLGGFEKFAEWGLVK